MDRIKLTVTFNTPAFLGDAEQKGAWRTSPFKALLRHWWRVVKANELLRGGVSACELHKEVREAEARLFGHAWLKEYKKADGSREQGAWALRSRVRLTLGHWGRGNLQAWQRPQAAGVRNTPCIVHHREVQYNRGEIDPFAYLGYGPLQSDRRQGARLKKPPAIKEREHNELIVILLSEFKKEMVLALQLIHWFGTVGGRSRNGWGSLSLDGKDLMGSNALSADLVAYVSRSLDECLELDWPHAIGTDDYGPLVWQTEPKTWDKVMQDLVQIKIDFRTALQFKSPRDTRGRPLEERHLLAYPVTNHPVDGWGQSQRLANQIRFKVLKNHDNKYVGLVFHLPCRMPDVLKKALVRTGNAKLLEELDQQALWQKVHQCLDDSKFGLQRLNRKA